MLRKYMRLLSGVLFVALCGPSSALAQAQLPAPNLNSEAPYAIVSSTYYQCQHRASNHHHRRYVLYDGTRTAPVTTNGSTVTPCPVATGIDQGNTVAFLNSQPCTSLGVGAVALNAVSCRGEPAWNLQSWLLFERRRDGYHCWARR